MTLFEWDEAHARARLSDPETSKEAARKIAPKITMLKGIILAHFAKHPNGVTDLELEEEFADFSPSSVRTRRSELARDGLLICTGIVHLRGSNRRVWKLAHQNTAETPF
jgi:hypothetical protein